MNQPWLSCLPELIFLIYHIQVSRLDNMNSLTETDFFFCIYVGVSENKMCVYHILINGLSSLL